MTAENSFGTWLDQVHAQYDVRLSIKQGSEWIDRRSIIANIDTIKMATPPSDEETRHYMRTDDSIGKNVVQTWKRYVFPIISSDGENLGNREQMELVLELPQEATKQGLSWIESDSIVLPTESLEVHSDEAFSAVAADRVAGLSQEKERLTRFLQTENTEWGLAEETGIILEGPPGTGKTELVIELCQELYGSMPVMISGPEILSKWVGESERMLRKKFEEARNANQGQPVLYIDELDAIARTRSEASDEYSAQIVAQLLVLLDGVEAKQEDEQETSLKVIASTNLSHVIDPALRRPGRLGSRPIHFDRPDSQERKAILHHYLEQIRLSRTGKLRDGLSSFVNGEDMDVLDAVIDETEGFTGADLEDLVQAAVSKLQKKKETSITPSFLKNFACNEFDPVDTIDSETIDPVNGSNGEFDDPLECRVHKLASEQEVPQDVATRYFTQLVDWYDRDQDLTFKFREITPNEFLADDPVRAKENVVEAFHHAEKERICLYISGTDDLVRTREYSSLIKRIIGMINEQLLQWNQENLLIIDQVPDSYIGITDLDTQ